MALIYLYFENVRSKIFLTKTSPLLLPPCSLGHSHETDTPNTVQSLRVCNGSVLSPDPSLPTTPSPATKSSANCQSPFNAHLGCSPTATQNFFLRDKYNHIPSPKIQWKDSSVHSPYIKRGERETHAISSGQILLSEASMRKQKRSDVRTRRTIWPVYGK